MKGFILASASAIALALGGAAPAFAWSSHYSGSSYQGALEPYGADYTEYTRVAYPQSGNFARVTHSQVARTQATLARAGLYFGPIDGILGPQTSVALFRWQARRGLPATGGFNPPTMASLGLSTAPPYAFARGIETVGYGSSVPYQGTIAPYDAGYDYGY